MSFLKFIIVGTHRRRHVINETGYKEDSPNLYSDSSIEWTLLLNLNLDSLSIQIQLSSIPLDGTTWRIWLNDLCLVVMEAVADQCCVAISCLFLRKVVGGFVAKMLDCRFISQLTSSAFKTLTPFISNTAVDVFSFFRNDGTAPILLEIQMSQFDMIFTQIWTLLLEIIQFLTSY